MRLLLSLVFATSTFSQELLTFAPEDSGGGVGTVIEFGGDGRLYAGASVADGAESHTGAVYSFDAQTGAQVRKFTVPNGESGDEFGYSIDQRDGVLLVGAKREDANGISQAGAAYLIHSETGAVLHHLTSSTPYQSGNFGHCVALENGLAAVRSTRTSHSGNEPHDVHVFDVATGALLNHLEFDWGGSGGPDSMVLEGGILYLANPYFEWPDGHDGALMAFDALTGSLLTMVDRRVWRIDSDGTRLIASHGTGALDGVTVYDMNLSPLQELTMPSLWDSAIDRRVAIQGDYAVLGQGFGSLGVANLYHLPTGDRDRIQTAGGNSWTFLNQAVALNGSTVFFGSPGNIGRVFLLGHKPVGTEYCTAVPNSLGIEGRIEAGGSEVVAEDNFWLRAYDLPAGKATLLINGPQQVFVMQPGGSVGNLCVGGGLGRHTNSFATTGTAGTVVSPVSLSALPQNGGPIAVQPGDTWHFQAWHRDGATSNFTRATSVTFQ